MMLRIFFIFVILQSSLSLGQNTPSNSVARTWMDTYLYTVTMDGLGPTVHARNLFHLSTVFYDTWAVYNPKKAETVFLGKQWGEYTCAFDGFTLPEGQNVDSALNISLHYASYRMIHYRYDEYSSKSRTLDTVELLFESLGLDPYYTNKDYSSGDAAALGNYIAFQMAEFGFQEPAGDVDGYEGNNYNPINLPLYPNRPGSQGLKYKNRWQPLSILDYIEKRGWDTTLHYWNYQLIGNEDVFLTPHWGLVTPFAMTDADKKDVVNPEGDPFTVYCDPGPPPYIGPDADPENSDAYKWNFALVSSWGSHNDPRDNELIDISPKSIGSTRGILPEKYSDYPDFFDLVNGGTKTNTTKTNPKTGKPYQTNMVKRGDYTRVIAEYWVDGVNTMTPPGHWVNTLNDVSDHPEFVKKWMGKGKILDDLEWDVKSYLTLTGALHDAGISAWSIKAYYDYIRPISAIRWMADNGQSSDPNLPNYHPEGIILVPGKIELVQKRDPLVGDDQQHLNKIKVKTWRGPEYINDISKEIAGVDWVLAENWWPYQRYSFTTPPFAGYVSGHSTFSTAASEVLTLITGDPYFPGGLAEHHFQKEEFLQFENGPSMDITLQWATYREASDETCLSRIWGGIHPPVDDIQGRKIGEKIGRKTVEFVRKYFK